MCEKSPPVPACTCWLMSSGDMMRLIRADAQKYCKAVKLAGIKAE